MIPCSAIIRHFVVYNIPIGLPRPGAHQDMAKAESSHGEHLGHNFSYGEIFSGQSGAWLVKKYILYACNHKSAEMKIILEFKTISRTCFVFLIVFTVYELWPVSIFIMTTAT